MKEYTVGDYKFVEYGSYEEFLQARNSFDLALGGSDMSVLMGVNEYASLPMLFDQKLGIADPPNLEENKAVYWGTVLEDIVADKSQYYNFDNHKYMTEQQQRLHVDFPFTVQYSGLPFMFANVDRLVAREDDFSDFCEDIRNGVPINPEGISEMKTMSKFTYDKYKDGLPYGYVLQVLSYMAQFLGMNGSIDGYIFSLVDGRDLHGYRIQYDESLVDEMVNAAYDFHELLQKGRDIIENSTSDRQQRIGLAEIRPEPDDSENLTKHMNENYLSKLEIDTVALGDEHTLELVRKYKKVNEEEKAIKSEKTLVTNQIKNELVKYDAQTVNLPNEMGYIRQVKKLVVKLEEE